MVLNLSQTRKMRRKVHFSSFSETLKNYISFLPETTVPTKVILQSKKRTVYMRKKTRCRRQASSLILAAPENSAYRYGRRRHVTHCQRNHAKFNLIFFTVSRKKRFMGTYIYIFTCFSEEKSMTKETKGLCLQLTGHHTVAGNQHWWVKSSTFWCSLSTPCSYISFCVKLHGGKAK